ncbi:VirB4 family type IV secretion/conjugal transfer ATPase [Helicobacter sp. T3_23-1059]
MNLFEYFEKKFWKMIYGIVPNQYSICQENNIIGKFDSDFLLTKNENFVGGIEIKGVNYNSATTENMSNLFLTRLNALNALTDNIQARIIVKRREIAYDKQYHIDNKYASSIINKWERNERIYQNSYFIFFETCTQATKGFFERKKLELTTSIKEDSAKNNITYVNKISILKSTIERFLQSLEYYEPRKLSADEILQHYAEYINGVFIPFRVTEGLLNDSYIASNVEFKKDYFIQDFNGQKTYNRFIAIKAYDTDIITSLTISSILHSHIDLDIYLSLSTIGKELAKRKLERKRQFATSGVKIQIAELLEMVESDRVILQNISYCILVKAKTKEQLNEDSIIIQNTLKDSGLVAVFENINLQPTFFSMFPNRANLNPRKRLHPSKNISTMILFEKEYLGRKSNSWGKTPVALFKNQSMSPYLFNFHSNEDENTVGHTMIIGGTGAGKTTLMSFIIANLYKYDIDILALDRLNGLYSVTEFLNGEYNTGEDFHINPCSLPNDIENINFLTDWYAQMIGISTDPKSEEEAQKIKAINKVIEDLYKNLSGQKIAFNIKDVKESITKTGDMQIPLQLERYCDNPLFNSIDDSLEFSKKLTTLNMDFIVNMEKEASLIARYMFHKMIYNAKSNSKGFFIFIDEFKSYLDNEVFNDRINITLTQARKLNGVMAMAFQDLNQLDGVKNAKSFLQNLAHIIIFPTTNLENFDKYNIYLTDNEINFLVSTPQNARKVLIKNLITGASNIVDVNLAKLGRYLKILSSDAQTVQKIKKLKINNPSFWKEEYLNS